MNDVLTYPYGKDGLLVKITPNEIRRMLDSEKVRFVENLLLSTNRNGIGNVVKYLKDSDFYYAPASSKYHSNYAGGLVDHSLMVYMSCCILASEILTKTDKDSPLPTESNIIISSLLHDICKCYLYKPAQKWKKDSSGNWVSESGYDVVDMFPIGHGEKSVIILQSIGLSMEAAEMLAIRYHMGMLGTVTSDLRLAQNAASAATPLVPLLQMADYSASTILES